MTSATSLQGTILARLPDEPLPVMRAINEGVPIVQSAPNERVVPGVQSDGNGSHQELLRRRLSRMRKQLPPRVRRGSGRWMRPTSRKKASSLTILTGEFDRWSRNREVELCHYSND